MIDGPSLPEFCAEMQRLAAVIEARSEILPACGGRDEGGLRVSLSEGAVYVLTYREKSDVSVVIENTDPEAVMERVFVEVTDRMAAAAQSAGEPPLTAADLDVFQQLSADQSERLAVEYQAEVGRIQLGLMSRLNPEWGVRQAERNAARAHFLRAFFGGAEGK